MNPAHTNPVHPFSRWTLSLAGLYNLAWGAVVVVFPMEPFDWLNLPRPAYPQIWQCVGMIVGVYGVGYLIAANDPIRHWPIVLVGLLGKVLGPVGFLSAAIRGEIPWAFGWTILSNDVIWWLPFTLILREAWAHHRVRTVHRPVRTRRQ